MAFQCSVSWTLQAGHMGTGIIAQHAIPHDYAGMLLLDDSGLDHAFDTKESAEKLYIQVGWRHGAMVKAAAKGVVCGGVLFCWLVNGMSA